MSAKQSICLACAILGLVILLFAVVFGDSGLADLNILRREKRTIDTLNERIAQENLLKYREIDRLKTDLNYIEEVARDELGMIKPGELVIKRKPSKDGGEE